MKRMISVLLTVLFVLLAAVPVAAAEPEAEITLDGWGDISQITFPAGMTSYTIPLSVGGTRINGIAARCKFVGSVSSLTIPSGISLESYSLSNCTAQSVTLATSSLPEGLFQGCSSLVSVTLPSGITEIPAYIFSNCTSLSAAGIPSSVVKIGDGAFSGCSSLTSVNFGSSVRVIGDNAFADCGKLSRINTDGKEAFPAVTSIGGSAFYGSALASVILPDTVTTLGKFAFAHSKSLTDLYIGSSITTIPERCFLGCNNLYKVSGGEKLSEIGKGAFEYAFSNDRNDAKLVLRESISKIDDSAFANCSYIESIEIYNGNCRIHADAFKGTRTTIKSYKGGTVEEFCSKTASIKFESLTGSTEDVESYDDLQYVVENGSVHITAYLGSGNATVVIPAKINDRPVTVIGANAFMRSDVQNVVLPASITAIEDHAFASCDSLKTIVILDKCTSIAPTAFTNASSELTVKGEQNTHAMMYAREHNIKFAALTSTEYQCYSGNHGETYTEKAEPTCDKDGYERTICKNCNTVISEKILPKRTEHEFTVTTVAPTCTAEGYTLKKCKYCDKSEKTDIKAALGHSWGDWVVTVKPTYSKEGVELRHCTRTGCNESESRAVPMLTVASFDEILAKIEIDFTMVKKETEDGDTVKLLCGFDAAQDVTKFEALFGSDYNIVIVDSKNTIKKSGYIATGDRFVLIDEQNTILDALTVVVKGDVNGDGRVNSSDYIAQRRSILGVMKLSDAAYAAADINGNGSLMSNDYIILRRYLLGIIASL